MTRSLPDSTRTLILRLFERGLGSRIVIALVRNETIEAVHLPPKWALRREPEFRHPPKEDA